MLLPQGRKCPKWVDFGPLFGDPPRLRRSAYLPHGLMERKVGDLFKEANAFFEEIVFLGRFPFREAPRARLA